MRFSLPAIFLLAALASTAAGDTVFMRDGSVRQGTIIRRTSDELRLQMNADGISISMVIPLKQVDHIVYDPLPAAPSRPNPRTPTPATAATSQPAPATLPASPDFVPTASDAELDAYTSRGFVYELLVSAADKGLTDIRRLPAAQRELWERALKADEQGHKVETLDALRDLEAAMQTLPDGIARLNAISRHVRQQSFGIWMAKLHWELVSDKFSTGQFDLKDVRDVERPALIGLLKQNTNPALDPLKSYFPPVDPKTGQLTAFRTTQLQGITTANALDVKDQALRAAAILAAQLKIEPQMPAVDRNLLSTQLATVNRILSRARDLEPQAKAAIAKAEQDKRIAEEKAKRDAAIAAQRKPKPTP